MKLGHSPRVHAWRIILLAAFVLAASAAPSAAILIKLPSGRFANYAPLAGSKTARIFDAAFTNLDYSGGPVMPSNTNYVVEWSPSNYGSRTPFQNGYISGVTTFFNDMAQDSGQSTNSDAVSTQYNDASGATAAYSFSNGGLLLDTDPLPPNGCPVAQSGDICITDAQIQTELNHFLVGHLHDLSHEYYLLTPPDVASCFAAGSLCSANLDTHPTQAYCAYHSTSSAGFIYSNIPDLTGVDGCDPFTTNGPFCPNFSCTYDNGPADGVLSAISHEHNESITDPQPNNAWTDWGSNVGGEIGDKCNLDSFSDPNLQFGGASSDEPYNETINGNHYLLQREWSNQTAQCLDSFTSNGTAATASFTSTSGSGNTVNFDASTSTATGGVAEYVWQFNDGPYPQNSTIETTSPTISHTFPSTGTYSVALTVMASDGTSNGTANNVTVGGCTAPTAKFGAPSGLEGTSLTFDGSGSTGSITSYSWAFGDGTTGTGAVAHHTYAKYGSYTASLTATGPCGSSSLSHTVLVTDETPTSSFTFSPTTPSAGTPVSFSGSTSSDPDGSIVSYSWNFGDGTAPISGGSSSMSHTYGAPGNYTVTLSVTDIAGGVASSSQVINVLPAFRTPTASFTAPSSALTGQAVAFDGSWSSDPNAGGTLSYSWSFGDGGSASGVTVSHAFVAGTFTVTLTIRDSASGLTNSTSRVVTISNPTHGPQQPKCVVPKLKGKTLSAARKLLAAAHCKLGTVKTPRKPKRSAGRHHKWELVVAKQSPLAGRTEPKDTRVSLMLAYKAVKTH